MRMFFILSLVLLLHAATGQEIVVPYRVSAIEWNLVEKYSKKKLLGPYFRIDYVEDSIYMVWKNSVVGLVHASGKQLTEIKYSPLPTTKTFSDGMFPMKDQDERIYFFDKTGRVAFEWKFDSPPFPYVYYNNGLLDAPVGFLDKKGKKVIPRYEHIAAAQFDDNGFCQVGKKEGNNVKWGVIDKKNKFIVPLKYAYLELEDDHVLASHEAMRQEEAFDLKGRKIVKGNYDQLKVFPSLGLYAYCKDGENYIYTLRRIKDNKEISDRYDEFRQVSKNRLLVGVDQKEWYIIDSKGAVIAKLPAESPSTISSVFPERLAYTNMKGELCVSDADGKTLFTLPEDLSLVGDQHKDFYEVRNYKANKAGCINLKGEWLVPLEYDFVKAFPELKLWRVRKGGIEYFIDEKGNKYTE